MRSTRSSAIALVMVDLFVLGFIVTMMLCVRNNHAAPERVETVGHHNTNSFRRRLAASAADGDVLSTADRKRCMQVRMILRPEQSVLRSSQPYFHQP